MKQDSHHSIQNLSARGEPFQWAMGGALFIGMFMILGLAGLILINGLTAFFPKPVFRLELADSKVIAGEPIRHDTFKPGEHMLNSLDKNMSDAIQLKGGFSNRTLYRVCNFDLYSQDHVWVEDYNIKTFSKPSDIYMVERAEWGPFIGFIKLLIIADKTIAFTDQAMKMLSDEHARAVKRKKQIYHIRKKEIGRVNDAIEKKRLFLKKILLKHDQESKRYQNAYKTGAVDLEQLKIKYDELKKQADLIKKEDSNYVVVLADINGITKTVKLSDMIRYYPANDLTFFEKISIYVSRWIEFLTDPPREANTEGGVMPAIFGTCVMTLLMVIFVAPFGVIASLYLREYAKQGRVVAIVRVCVNNLAGVPSIVYGVFGLGFFAYIIGGSIDTLFFPERLPNPTFGTGGILWAALTLAILTVPVVIVATEEALSSVPNSLREASLSCGASKWQTIKNIVLPKAMPGIMTGLILAMARGAGEVAPLMLVGVVKLAPDLPIDGIFPFIHLEKSFMHLGFHIFDVGFQSRNSEAGKPMVFVTTLLLIGLISVMNAAAIYIRNRLKRKYYTGHF
jgi:phosphate transport system permease protein